MAGFTGADLFLQFGSKVLDTDFRAFSQTETGNVVDASAGADTTRTYLTTLKDGTATATIVLQEGTAGTQVWAALAPLTGGTLMWAEGGSAAGTQVHTVYAYVTERRKSMAYTDLVVVDLSWQFSSGITPGTW